ncbi:maleate cis-trans isomerase family protein [Ornithinicoccus halotolerans]|uniref:maleate cis-trans isomerase family protein n=1 Tax=Ornithinicoccus halotolerans TaxID=1748220 RepID=UPI0012976929|nr:aspartate/glutamate racemase family protein [Ornithinicoccus halotolerans]
MTRHLRIGMLTPSSNTCLEPVTQQTAADLPEVSVHFTRVPVVKLNLGEESVTQFQVEPMVRAAHLLADAEVDVIAWNGTSGSWLGLEHDRQICAAIQSATGVKATTTTLALFEAFRRLQVTRCALAVPYIAQLTERIELTYADNGVTCVSEAHLGLESNVAIGRVRPPQVDRLVEQAVGEGAQAVAIVCTNVWGAPCVPSLEARLGIPVLDSVLVTLWECLRLVGRPAPELADDWGRLFALPTDQEGPQS